MKNIEPKGNDGLKEVFDILDGKIQEIIDKKDENPEKALADLYWGFFNMLKDKVGTSSGYSGLSEYLFYRYIMFYLEKNINNVDQKKFLPNQRTKDTEVFYWDNMDELIITHDVNINAYVGINQKTDIALFVKQNNNMVLIAGFQIKIFIKDQNIYNDEIKKLEELTGCKDALVLEILLMRTSFTRHTNLSTFLGENSRKGRAFLIYPYVDILDIEIPKDLRINLNDALDKIIDKIRSFKIVGF